MLIKKTLLFKTIHFNKNKVISRKKYKKIKKKWLDNNLNKLKIIKLKINSKILKKS